METVSVPLTQGKVAIIDAEDAERVLAHKWYAHESRGKFYAARQVRVAPGKQKRVFLHIELMQPPKGMQVDHVNGDSLDCRRENMRCSTQAQNVRNAGLRKDNTSGFRGVSFYKLTGRWVAHIALDGKIENLGYYATPEDAARAYDARARELHGQFARLNFPDEAPAPFVKPGLVANNTSGHTGVSYMKGNGTWIAYMRVNGRRVHLGSFRDKESAVHAREDALRALDEDTGAS